MVVEFLFLMLLCLVGGFYDRLDPVLCWLVVMFAVRCYFALAVGIVGLCGLLVWFVCCIGRAVCVCIRDCLLWMVCWLFVGLWVVVC